MSSTLLNRTVQALMTNKSGGALAQGDVVIVDSANANAVTTTTTSGYKNGKVGVVIEPNGIANNAAGMIAFEGWVPKINLSGSASLADLVKTHTVAGQGVRHAAPLVAGDFAQVLETGTSPRAILLGHIEQGAAGGAPTTSEYVTTATDGSLSAEVAIPGLAGSPDIAGAAGAGTSEEYDTTTVGITWDSSPTTVDSDTTAKSHLYVKNSGATTVRRGTKAWAPAGGFDVRCKITIGGTLTSDQYFGLWINDNASADGNGVLLHFAVAPGTPRFYFQAFTSASAVFTQRGLTWPCYTNKVYLRIKRDGSNNVSFYFSFDGLAWQLIATQSFTFTPSRLGYRAALANAGDILEAFVDWLRTDV